MSGKQKEVYGDRFFRRRYRKYHEKEVGLANIIYDYFRPETVIDAGCGIGSYLCAMKERGALVMGLEYGAKHAKKYAPESIKEYIHACDLSHPISSDIRADLVLCIEVAEHIQPGHSNALINNLCSLSSKHILFTAARPGARGKGHINCRPLSDWITKFVCGGCHVNPVMTGDMRAGFNAIGDPLNLSKNLLVVSKNA